MAAGETSPPPIEAFDAHPPPVDAISGCNPAPLIGAAGSHDLDAAAAASDFDVHPPPADYDRDDASLCFSKLSPGYEPSSPSYSSSPAFSVLSTGYEPSSASSYSSPAFSVLSTGYEPSSAASYSSPAFSVLSPVYEPSRAASYSSPAFSVLSPVYEPSSASFTSHSCSTKWSPDNYHSNASIGFPGINPLPDKDAFFDEEVGTFSPPPLPIGADCCDDPLIYARLGAACAAAFARLGCVPKMPGIKTFVDSLWEGFMTGTSTPSSGAQLQIEAERMLLRPAKRSPEGTIEETLHPMPYLFGGVPLAIEKIACLGSESSEAISSLEELLPLDHQWMIDLHFKLCHVLEASSKMEEAIPHCEKVIILCRSRMGRLKENSSGGLSSESQNCLDELEFLQKVMDAHKKKLEFLQQAMADPKPVIPVFMEMTPPGEESSPPGASDEVAAAPSSSSPMAASGDESGGNGIDRPIVSIVASDDGATQLGVVGRGVKRVVVASICDEPSSKKPRSSELQEAGMKGSCIKNGCC